MGTFVPGPPIEPPGPLLEWLNTAAAAEDLPVVRLPVVARFKDHYRLGIDDAFIGVTDSEPGPDAIRLSLDEGLLGSEIVIDKVRRQVPKGPGGCALWLDGIWGGVIPIDDPTATPNSWPFTVLHIGDLIGDQPPLARHTHAMIEVSIQPG
ncbi:MAG: hypothetical protein ACRDTE_27660 [Pseudonocardiaceae bacterium]